MSRRSAAAPRLVSTAPCLPHRRCSARAVLSSMQKAASRAIRVKRAPSARVCVNAIYVGINRRKRR